MSRALMRHLRCHPTGFGKDRRYIGIPASALNGAQSIILARWNGCLRPFAVTLPHQIYVADLPTLMGGAPELWALPVGVPGRWIQVAGPKPGTVHPPLGIT